MQVERWDSAKAKEATAEINAETAAAAASLAAATEAAAAAAAEAEAAARMAAAAAAPEAAVLVTELLAGARAPLPADAKAAAEEYTARLVTHVGKAAMRFLDATSPRRRAAGAPTGAPTGAPAGAAGLSTRALPTLQSAAATSGVAAHSGAAAPRPRPPDVSSTTAPAPKRHLSSSLKKAGAASLK